MNGDKINGRTLDEIKKGLECCQTNMTTKYKVCGKCGYFNDGFGCESILMRDAIAYIQQLEAAAPKWISVEDPPKDMRKVFVYLRDGTMAVTYYNPLSEMWDFNHDYKITHWMPLPEPPKELINE